MLNVKSWESIEQYKANSQSYHIITPVAAAAKSLQLCLTLCDPIDCSPPGSPVPGILQARTMEWAARRLNFIWSLLILDGLPIPGELFLKICPQLSGLLPQNPSSSSYSCLQLFHGWSHCPSVTFIFFFSPFELSSTCTLVSRANQPNQVLWDTGPWRF